MKDLYSGLSQQKPGTSKEVSGFCVTYKTVIHDSSSNINSTNSLIGENIPENYLNYKSKYGIIIILIMKGAKSFVTDNYL